MAAEVFFVAIASLVVAQKSLRALKSEPGSCGSSRSLLEDSGSSLLDDSAEELDSETSLDEDASSDELEAISLLEAGATEDEELSAGFSLEDLSTFSLLEEAFSASLDDLGSALLEAGATDDEDSTSGKLTVQTATTRFASSSTTSLRPSSPISSSVPVLTGLSQSISGSTGSSSSAR
jgi:hypothetical protein